MHLTRIGDDDATDKLRDRLHHGLGITSCLDHNMVIVRQFRGERSQMLARHVDAAQPDQLVAIYHHRLGEGAMNIHSYDPHELPPRSDRKRAGNTATTDSRSQRIRADRRGGQITARALSPWS